MFLVKHFICLFSTSVFFLVFRHLFVGSLESEYFQRIVFIFHSALRRTHWITLSANLVYLYLSLWYVKNCILCFEYVAEKKEKLNGIQCVHKLSLCNLNWMALNKILRFLLRTHCLLPLLLSLTIVFCIFGCRRYRSKFYLQTSFCKTSCETQFSESFCCCCFCCFCVFALHLDWALVTVLFSIFLLHSSLSLSPYFCNFGLTECFFGKVFHESLFAYKA